MSFWKSRGRRLGSSNWSRSEHRRLIAGLIAAGVACCLVGCLIGVGGTLVYSHLSGQLEPGKLTILSGKDSSNGGQRQLLIDLWNAEHPDQPAAIEELPATTDSQRNAMVHRAQAQQESGKAAIDIYNLDITSIAEFASEGYVQTIDEPKAVLDEFVPNVVDAGRYDGSLWALPWNTDAGLMFYRSDLVIPAPSDRKSDWQSIMQWGKRIPQLRTNEPRLAVSYLGQRGNYEGATVNGIEALWSAGVNEIVDANANRVIFDRAKWEEAFRQLAAALRLVPGSDLSDTPGSRTDIYNEQQALQDFRQGRALFMRNWPVEYNYLTGQDVPPSQRLPVGVAQLPGGKSALGGQSLAIARQSKHPKAAKALIEFLTSEAAQRRLFVFGGFAPSRNALYQDTGDPYLLTLHNAVTTAKARPKVRKYSAFSAEFQAGMREALEKDGRLPKNFEDRLNQALQGR